MRLIQIFTHTLDQANAVLEELNSDNSFETLYEKYQTVYPHCVDITEREPKFENFEAAVNTLNVGEYTKEPINTFFGYHIVYRTE